MPQESFIAKLTQLVALYVVYVFLSGWTFFDFYYRQFGVDPRWFDLPVQETLVKGFTVLFTSGTWLWACYGIMLLVPLWVDGSAKLRDRFLVRMLVGGVMIGVLLCVFFISKSAGISEAKHDQAGTPTRLAPVTFTLKACAERNELKSKEISRTGQHKVLQETTLPKCDYSGQILIFRNGVYYLYKVAPLREQPPANLALQVYRAEELINLTIAGQ